MPYAGSEPRRVGTVRVGTWDRISSQSEQPSVRDLIKITKLMKDDGRRLFDFVAFQLAEVCV
jgi:hypothetical protein